MLRVLPSPSLSVNLSEVPALLESSVLLEFSVLLESVVEDPAELVALLEQPATAPRIDADANTAAKILFFIGNSSRSIHCCE